jgi:UDP-glucose:tetrahydrobiopterin glucosyltransferase
MKILMLSSPVGPLGTGSCGGLDLTIPLLCTQFTKTGHSPTVIAPKGSKLKNTPLIEIEGAYQHSLQTQLKNAPIQIPADPVIGNMCLKAHEIQYEYDIILNFSYDWLPFYLTPYFERPLTHWLSMSSLSVPLEQIVKKILLAYPNTLGVFTYAQAETFKTIQPELFTVLGNGLDLTQYEYASTPLNYLAWMGRIAPEKGLEDALTAAQEANLPLKIMGYLENQDYWKCLQRHPYFTQTEYLGFLPTHELQKHLRYAQALLVTPKWIEAFGNVAMESLACGVPVISYSRGGLKEIVKDGKTGFLVQPDSISGLVDAIHLLYQIDRQSCRTQAETEFSIEALSSRVISWLKIILSGVHER